MSLRWFSALLLGVPLMANGSNLLWDEAGARALAPTAATQPRVEELLDLAPLLPAEDLARRIDLILSDPTLSLPARERVLRDFAYQLRGFRPDPVIQRQLEQLAGYLPQVKVAHPESRGSLGIALYDVASAARGTLNTWIRFDAEQLATDAIRRQDDAALKALIGSGHRQQIAGAARAMGDAPPDQARKIGHRLVEQLEVHPELTALVQAAGQNSRDADLLDAVIRSGHAPWSMRTLTQLAQWIDPNQALAIWMELARHPNAPLAAAAVAELGKRIDQHPAIAKTIEDSLAHPEIGSAAALALSRLDDEVLLHSLARTLAGEGALLTRQRALLSLRLSNHPLAADLVARFATSTDDELAREARQWIR